MIHDGSFPSCRYGFQTDELNGGGKPNTEVEQRVRMLGQKYNIAVYLGETAKQGLVCK